jgi:perosamine synthetase
VRALGLGEGDEVITTPFSFVASANCLLYERARPVFVDIEPQALNLDPEKVKAAITEHTKAILAVDVFGHPADWDQIAAIAQKHGLKLIEDSAEAFGSSYRGRRAGGLGDVGVFGFYPNKQITTGEGGAILTDIEEIAQLCRSMRNQGRSERVDWLEHEHLGYNYRLDELSAALGVAQLARIDEILARRARVAQLYEQKLKDMDEVKTPSLTPGVTPSWFAYVIRFVQGIDRDRLMEYMKTHGVQTRAYFSPIHLQPFYQKLFGYREGDFPLTEEISRRVLSLPFYGQMREEEIDYVVRTLKKGLRILRS